MVYTRGGGVISESYLPNASVVGLFLQKEDGTPYDNLPYNNIPYVATGTGASQTWSPQSADKQILLSSTEGKAYAYYPYNSENTSFSSIHLDASRQDDVMYTSTASTGLNDKNADASFELQHALAVMKVKVKKGSYTGPGNVTSCSISGSPIGLTGTLDGTTGNLSGVTAGKVSADKTYTISGTATEHDIIFVPTTTAGQVTVGLTMDGKEYTTTTTSSETFVSNQCYTLNLTVDDSGATLSGIEVGNWSMSGSGNSVITAGGYKITFAGNYAGIAFSVSESGKVVTIQASGTEANTCPKEVTATKSITQSANAQTRTIVLSNLNSDATITFYGLENIPANWSWSLAEQFEGVWGIKNNLPITYKSAIQEASLDGVAIVMYGRALQISNNQTSSVWGSTSVNISGITEVTVVGGGVTNSGGCLLRPDGTYKTSDESNQIKADHTTWQNYSSTALADTCGWKNTKALITTQGSSYLGGATKTFRNNSSVNQGYKDWFVPSAAQLAYIYMNYDKINELLNKCSGATKLGYMTTMNSTYWSSSEYDTYSAWYVGFDYTNDGTVSWFGKGDGKSNNYYVRFCRDLN